MNLMDIDVQTPERTLFSGKITSLTAKAVDGEIGILPGHAPLATMLDKGSIRCRLQNGEEKKYVIKSGFLIIYNNKVSALIGA